MGLAVLAGLNLTVRNDPAAPNFQFLPEMVRAVPYESFSENPNFPDGKTLQAPVPGAIPRGHLPLHFTASPEEAARAARELRNPFTPAGAQAVERGAFLYVTFCRPCHGPTGNGDGPVVMKGYPAPPPVTSDKTRELQDGQIFHIVTFGQKNMPSHATQLSREDRWKVILHIRALQKPAPAPETGAPR
ncbi:MAG: cytochrome c [Candidatus Solibacter usitatus]|nr:cytochrome c [Candidatus Solibacter usitatus]